MTNTERAIKLFTDAIDKHDNGENKMSENEVITFGIDLKNGTTIITPDWETMKQYVIGGDVTMVIVCQSGEILYDVRDGWNIVTKSPSRVA